MSLSLRNRGGVILSVLTAFMGLLYFQTSTDSVSANSEKINVTEDDHGKIIRVAEGDTLAIRLKAQLGTGYSWSVMTHVPSLLKPIGEAKQEKLNGLPGGYEYQVFLFEARQEGTCVLELNYIRPWEKQGLPERLFRITVHISSHK
jgi:predicted secreted protein